MKRRLLSFLLCLCFLLEAVALSPVFEAIRANAATTSQNNIVARANYMYDSTWVCQKTVTGWKGSYTFTKGSTYRIPYGQPVYAGAYIGFSVSVEDFLTATQDSNSVFYTSKSNYAGKTSTYYANDCSAYVSWCWGTARQTTATIPNISTYIGSVTTSNATGKLQLGDCLNSNSAGHVVLVTGLTYNSSGSITQIEITEQTPPQLKRSYYTPSSLASKYGSSYSIYRYTGTVPAAPSSSGSAVTGFGTKVSAKVKNWVFNADYYRDKYTDLASMTDSQLYEHYLNYGITEGRQASALFNVKYYLNQNDELKDIFGSNYEEAFNHFVEYGQYESSRVYSKQLTAIKDVIFDPDFYCTMYPAVAESYGDDTGRIFANFIKTGLSKGRLASPVFDVSHYINGNDDLASVYADDYYGAIHHFITNGQNESRVVSPILDTGYYTDKYSDAAGLPCLEAMEHFLSTGLKEGRQGSSNFLAEFYYFAKSSHLEGYTLEDCYLHYLKTGHSEGLRAAPYAQFPAEAVNLGLGFTARLTNLKSGLNLSISGTSVIIYPASDSDAQMWQFRRQDDGSYEITNVKYGTVLTASDQGSADGLISIAEDVDGINQRWFLYEENGYYVFRTACNKWVSIGLTDGETTSTTPIEMAYYRNNDAQKYTLSILSVDIEECTEHSYLSNVTTAPSCTAEGVSTYTCVNCGNSYTEALPATGHSYERTVTESTCTTDGQITCTCENCGDTYVEQELTAPGHNWSEATCTTPQTCSGCGETQGDVLGHVYRSTVTAPTCTDEGYTSYICVNCNDTLAIPGDPATGHSYEAGTCTVCGYVNSSVVTPTLTPKYPALTFEDEVLMNVYFDATDLDDVQEMGLITYEVPVAQGDISTADAVIPGCTYHESSGLYLASTEGIPAKNLGDTIYFAVYARLTNGSYAYSKLLSYSPATYAYSQLASGSTEMQPLVVAMLNYSAEAQTFFNYRTEQLVNRNLTQEQKALVQDYDPSMMDSVVNADSSKAGIFANVSGFSKRYPTVTFDGAFSIDYHFTPSQTPSGSLKMYYWTQADYEKASTLSPANATGSLYMTTDGDGEYHGRVEGIAAKDLDKTVYVAAGYNADDTSYCTGVLAYSIGAYCINQAANGTDQQAFAAATAVYGYYAKALFS